jgi:hypothetical protein
MGIFNIFYFGPYEKFHPKKHLPICEFFGNGQIIACEKNPTRISSCHETITKQ